MYMNRRNKSTDVLDEYVIWVVILLSSFGIVMVYSASIAYAEQASKGMNSQLYLEKHLIYVVVGLILSGFVFRVPMHLWQKYSGHLFVLGLMLLVVVLIPGIGKMANGARRWLPLGLFNVQPSECMKLFTVLYVSDYAVRKSHHLQNLKRGFLPVMMAMILVAFLLLREPDFGTLMVVLMVTMGLLFLGGIHWRIFSSLLVLVLISVTLLVVSSPYRLIRVMGFLDPWEDPFGKGYQLSQSLIAFGRGEWLGVGLGRSIEKLLYLPEAYTDFVMAVVGEEFGFLGVFATVICFFVLIYRAFSIGIEARKFDMPYSSLVAQGIGLWMAVQVFVNIGVSFGMLPTKGLTLPFLSFGGSSLVTNLVAIAILLRIDWENRRMMHSGEKPKRSQWQLTIS